MDRADWKVDLKGCFIDAKVLEKCREEAFEHFDQFCEYVAEAAFEALAEEFLGYQVKTRSWKVQGKSIHLEIRFPRSRVDQFHYILWMPRHSVELKLKLTVKWRRTPLGTLEEKTVPFLEKASPTEILKIDKDSMAQDVIARYRKYLYETAVAPE